MFCIALLIVAFLAIAESQNPAVCQQAADVLYLISSNGKLQWTPKSGSQRTIRRTYFTGGLEPEIEEDGFRSVDDLPGVPPNRKLPPNAGQISNGLPESYDASTVYPNCPIKRVVDQGQCSNCWVISAVSMINDRLCMHTGQQRLYSPKLFTCRSRCKPGISEWAVLAWANPQGGMIPEECQAFPNPTEISGFNQNLVCDAADCQQTCPVGCDDANRRLTPDQISFGARGFNITSQNEEDIMREIYQFGPVAAFMQVYEDFFCYTKGIYRHVTGQGAGPGGAPAGHYVKLYGWGVEDGVKYWLVANSWGNGWGENGLFKIQRGQNECSIEKFIAAAVSKEAMP